MEEKEIENFLSDSSEFIDSFEKDFIEFFVKLCKSYDNYYQEDILKEVATLVYKDIFNTDIFITTLEEDVFKEMIEDGVMIGFLINRSLFFLLENYIAFMKEKSEMIDCKKNIEVLVELLSSYINQFENKICHKSKLQPIHINFDTIEEYSSGHNILDIFKEIQHKEESVTFFNLYKGVPISHSGKIVSITDEEITFKTDKSQELAMKMEGVAYILRDHNFDKYIKADIKNHEFLKGKIILENFRYLLNMPATNREFVRVHPDIMAKVKLSSSSDLVTHGKLFDLSLNGIGVVSEENNGIYAGARIEIWFDLKLDNKLETIRVDGEVLNIIEYKDSYRYCIKIFPKAKIEDKIKKYVKLREAEILNSLDKESSNYM